ncbi:VWA domain-containing protein [Bacteroidota bacterium]
MIWFKSMGIIELMLILAFIVLYGFYIYRVIRIARSMQTRFTTVFYKVFIRTTYFSLFIIAMLGPSFGEATREVKTIGKDIYICVDLSESMNAFDIQPTRLEKIKFELKNIVDAFNSDRIGLIIFSSEAFIQCPLTFDQSGLRLFIETLNTNLVPNAGTDFGPPLKMALKKLNNPNSQTQDQKSKIIILISDGEDFGDEAENAAADIETSGIKLYTLGVGTEKGSKIRTHRGFKTDKNGREVVSKLNPREMKTMAIATSGKYYEINDRKNDVERLINSIENIEGELRDSRVVDVSANKYYYFLAAALLLMAIDLLYNIKTVRI